MGEKIEGARKSLRPNKLLNCLFINNFVSVETEIAHAHTFTLLFSFTYRHSRICIQFLVGCRSYSYFCRLIIPLGEDQMRSALYPRSSTCVGFCERFRTKRLRTNLASFIPTQVFDTKKRTGEETERRRKMGRENGRVREQN